MNPTVHYKNAPITEAVIELRVAACEGAGLDSLRSIPDRLTPEFPTAEDLFEGSGQLEFVPGERATASASQTQVGFRIPSNDGKHVINDRLSGFAFSRLAPYESWEPFRDAAKQKWLDYRKVIKPIEIKRLAVRYINRIDIPHPAVELKDYFRTSPEVSEDLPPHLTGFFMQLHISQKDIGSQLRINQTIVPPPQRDMVSVLLDLDLFRSDDVAQEESQIWDFFEILHDRKNDVFQSCITDKTRELFA